MRTAEHAPAEPRPPYILRRAIPTIKDALDIATVANDYGAELRPSGEDLRGKGVCHGGSNETALLVEPDRGRWWCFRCNEGGDVLDLCRAVEGGELWEAVVSLAERYNVELPRRSERWHGWQGEKVRRLNGMRGVLAESYRRRYFRLFRDHLAGIEDPKEREEEARAIWDDLWNLALGLAELRITRRAAA